jgi:hypothetical protein
LPLIKRIVRAGVVAALAAGLAGWTFERARLGASDEAALRRVEAELRERFDATAAALGSMATRVAANPDASSRPKTPAGPASPSTTASVNRLRGPDGYRTFPKSASSDRRPC